jgi:hypothetical protein
MIFSSDDDVYLKKITTRVSQNIILHKNTDQSKAWVRESTYLVSPTEFNWDDPVSDHIYLCDTGELILLYDDDDGGDGGDDDNGGDDGDDDDDDIDDDNDNNYDDNDDNDDPVSDHIYLYDDDDEMFT